MKRIVAIILFILSLLSVSVVKSQDSIVPGFLLKTEAAVNGGIVQIKDVAVSKNGAVYAVGYYSNTADFDPGPDTLNLNNSGYFVAKYSAGGKLLWAFSLDGVNISSVTTDNNDDVYITGSISYQADLDPGKDSAFFIAKDYDAFFAKYNASGNFVFAKQITGTNDQYGRDIKVNDSNNIFIAGFYEGNDADFDPGPGKAILPHDYKGDIFFAKYDANGNYLFAKGITGNYYDDVSAMALDKDGNILITGSFKSHTIDFDPGEGVKDVPLHGRSDAYVAKYTPQGNYIFAFSIGGVDDDYAGDITTDNNGNIFITGAFSAANVDFNPKTGVDSAALRSSKGGYDIFYAQYSPAGVFKFANTIGGVTDDKGYNIITDAQNNIIITGTFAGKGIDFSREPTLDTLSSTYKESDLFFAKYTNSGNYIYARQISGFKTETPAALTFTGNNNLLVAAYFSGKIDVDPGKNKKVFVSALTNSFFAVYNDNDGKLLAANVIDNYRSFELASRASRIKYDKENNLYVVGDYEGKIDFDPGPGSYYLTSASENAVYDDYSSANDIFFAKYTREGRLLFAKSISGAYGEYATDIFVDNDHNIYITGFIDEKVDFDPGPDTFYLSPQGGNIFGDFFAKYDQYGNFVFAKVLQLNDAYGSSISGITVDSLKTIYITGYFSKGDFDPGPGIVRKKAYGNTDVYFAKYDSAGNYINLQHIGQPKAYMNGGDIVLSGNGNLVLSGRFSGNNIDFDPGPNAFLLSSGNGPTQFIASYTTAGDFVFASSTYSYDGFCTPAKLVLDKKDNIYTTGRFDSKVDFKPGVDSFIVKAKNNKDDMYFQKYNADGKYVFTKTVAAQSDNNGYDISYGLYVDDYENIYVSGFIFDTVDFDPGNGRALIGTLYKKGVKNSSFFLARYDSSGNYNYANAFTEIEHSSYYKIAPDVLVNGYGEVYMAGLTSPFANTNFGVGTDTVLLNPDFEGANLFIMQYLQPDFCAIADSLYANNITANSALLHWRYPNQSQSFKVYYRPVGNKAWLSVAGSGLSKRINNLKPDTRYEWKLFALCSSDTSVYSEPAYFKTKASALFASDINMLHVDEEKPALSIYPNPAKNKVRISLLKANIQSIKITDAGGTVIYNNSNLNQISVDVNLSKVASGTYMLSVFDGNQTFNKKLLINK